MNRSIIVIAFTAMAIISLTPTTLTYATLTLLDPPKNQTGLRCQGTLDNPITMDDVAACQQRAAEEILAEMNQSQGNQSQGQGLPIISVSPPYIPHEDQQTDPMIEDEDVKNTSSTMT